jgi:hypothetical protein
VAAARSTIESKLVRPLLLAKHGAPSPGPGGSREFISGIAVIGRRLSVRRTKDIADSIIALLRKGFITGTVLRADGVHRLVWSRDRIRGGLTVWFQVRSIAGFNSKLAVGAPRG